MIKVKSGSSFEYFFHNADGSPVGTLKMPTCIAVPRNGWAKGVVPKSLKDHVTIEALARTFIVDYELLSDRAVASNDLRFFLMEGSQEITATNAVAMIKNRWAFNLNGNRYELAKVGGVFSSLHFNLTLDSRKVGEIVETTGFTLWSRSFTIALPDEINTPVQLFMFFLAANATYR